MDELRGDELRGRRFSSSSGEDAAGQVRGGMLEHQVLPLILALPKKAETAGLRIRPKGKMR